MASRVTPSCKLLPDSSQRWAAEDYRVADLIPPVEGPPQGKAELWKVVADNPELDPLITRTRHWRGAEILSGGGIGNARAVAEIHAIMANGGVSQGRRFLSEDGCRRALDVQVAGVDLVLGMPMRIGLGFALGAGLMPNDNTVYWGGYGGSLAIIDLDARTTIAYTPNRMTGGTGDLRALGLAMALGLIVLSLRSIRDVFISSNFDQDKEPAERYGQDPKPARCKDKPETRRDQNGSDPQEGKSPSLSPISRML